MRPIARYGFLGNVRKLLSQATFFIDAKEATVGQTVTNLGTAGSVLDARYGSTTGADTNDPLLLEHTGTNYLYLPGASGSTVSTPDSAALDITGDIEVVLRVSPDSWTGTDTRAFIGKSGASDVSWYLNLLGDKRVRFYNSPDGTTLKTHLTSNVLPFSGSDAGWLKVTLDVDNGASGSTMTVFYADDSVAEPTSWTTLQAITGAGTTSIFAGVSALQIGERGDGFWFVPGKFYRAIIRNGIGGTVVFDANFTTGITSGAQTTFTESSSNAATVTINRSTSGRKSVAVTRPVWLFGTDDYLEVADNALLDFGASDSFTVVAVARQWGTWTVVPLATKSVLGSTASTMTGYSLMFSTTGSARIGDGTRLVATVAAKSSGQLFAASMVRNKSSNGLQMFMDNTAGTAVADTTSGSLASSDALWIGQGSGGFADMELLAVAVFRRALSAEEITGIANYYGAS